MEFFIVGGRKFQIAEDAFLRAGYDMLFVVDCCLRSGAVEKQSILVDDVCWRRLHKRAGL